MKRLILLLILFAMPAYAEDVQVARLSPAIVGGSVPAVAPPSYLFEENFEGVGYEKTWAEDGTIDEDYTSVVLRGSQSLLVTSGETKGTLGSTLTECYGFFRIRFSVFPDYDVPLVRLWDDSANESLILYVDNDGTWAANHGTADGYGTYEMSIGTTYYVWFYWLKGTGVNGVLWLKIDTDRTIPVANDISITNGNSAYSATKAGFCTGENGVHVVDQFIIHTSAIGDVSE